MKKLNYLFVVILLLLSNELFSQVTVDGEFRPRIIVDDGYKTIKLKSDPALVYVSQRSRVNIGFKNEKLETYLSLQDVHFWGDDDMFSSSGVSGNTKGVNLFQAWFMLKPTHDISLKIGRQQFSYDDQRILSARNWNDYQVTYDAVLFSFSKNKSKLDAAVSLNASGASTAFYPKAKFKTLDFVRYEHTVGKFSLSGIALLTGNTKSDTIADVGLVGTYGTNLVYKEKSFDARLTGYYQHGLNEVSGSISAYCLSFFARKLLFDNKASVGVGLDWLSGNDGTNTSVAYAKVQHKFNSFYGNRHGLLGYMDFYTSIPDQGLCDYMVKTEYKFTNNLLLQADYHLFAMANESYDLIDKEVIADKGMGSELDLTLQWKINKEVTLQSGYSFYSTTESLEKWKKVYGKETRFPQFAYIMITVKPVFFKGE